MVSVESVATLYGVDPDRVRALVEANAETWALSQTLVLTCLILLVAFIVSFIAMLIFSEEHGCDFSVGVLGTCALGLLFAGVVWACAYPRLPFAHAEQAYLQHLSESATLDNAADAPRWPQAPDGGDCADADGSSDGEGDEDGEKFCPACGMKNDAENRYCVRCGEQLEPVTSK